MPEIEVKSQSPEIDREIEEIVKAMLKARTKLLLSNKKLWVTLRDGEVQITEPVEAEITIKIVVSDTFLENIKGVTQ